MSVQLMLKRHATAIATIILLVQTGIYYTGSAKETVPAIAPWRQFPTEVESWSAVNDLLIDDASLAVLQPDDYLVRNYVSPGDPHIVNLFVGYFNSRRNGRAPHSPEWCLPGAGWKSLSSKVISIPNGAQPLSANEYLIQKDGNEELVLYWYHQGGRTVASDVVAQIYSLPDLILHGRTDTALVRVIVPLGRDGLGAARAVGIRFAQAVYPLIRRHIT